MTRLIAALAVSALCILPLVSASWSSQGGFEPDVVADVSDGFMWPDPDVDPNPEHQQIYFNGFLTSSYSGVNPNFGATSSRVIAPGGQVPAAYLGIWKDCNRDGYVGVAETALSEYRALLLPDDKTCPHASGDFNRDGWVYEFLWIGWRDNAPLPSGIAPRLRDDPQARVWADRGLPSDLSDSLGCSAQPPTGTFQSTGGVVGWLDCHGQRGLVRRGNMILAGTGLEFEDDARPACSSSSLNVRLHLFARDSSCPSGRAGLLEAGTGEPLFVVWDCDASTDAGVARLPAPRPDLEGSGSLVDAATSFVSPATTGCTSSGGSSFDAVLVALGPEAAVASIPIKRETDFALEFFNDRGGNHLARVTPERAPANGGVTLLNSALPERGGPMWAASKVATDSPPTFRDDLSPEGPRHYTFYAHLGAEVRGAPWTPGGTGFYGAEACDATYEGVVGSVDCDWMHWWQPAWGASEMPTSTYSGRPIGARVGDEYHVRDIDCYDGTLVGGPGRGAGLGLSSLDEREGPCAPS